MYDVIVVGAGPGGAFTTKVVAKAGLDVVLIERESIPRDKPCAGWITPNVLRLTNIDISKLECYQPIEGAVLWESKGKELYPYIVKYRKPISYGIKRIEFDTLLVNDAKDAGAAVVDSTYVTKIHRQKDAIIVQASKGQEFRGRYVVGADGTHSLVARELKLREKWEPTELLQGLVMEKEIGSNIANLTDYYGYPELFLNSKTMSYSWYFTKSTALNIGLGIQMSKIASSTNARILYENFLRKLTQINHLEGVKLGALKAHTYPVYYGPYHYQTYTNRAVLIGDAGGFPINYTGEGIRTALMTGKFAAETIIEASEKGSKNLNQYYVKWSDALREEYLVGDFLQMIFHPSYYEMIKSLFIEERRFRELFFDLFFCVITPREALRRFMLYSPILVSRFMRFAGYSLFKDLIGFINV